MGSNLTLKPGSEVDYGERRFAIMQVISFKTSSPATSKR